MKIRPVVPCGQTAGGADMPKLIVAFCYFANARKMHGGLCLEILAELDSLEVSGVDETTSLT
jgi:hypothetical protein